MWCSVQPFIAVLAYLCGTGKGIFSTTHTSILASSVILCWNKLGKHMFPTVTFFVFLCLLTMSSSESAGMFYLLFFFFSFLPFPLFWRPQYFTVPPRQIFRCSSDLHDTGHHMRLPWDCCCFFRSNLPQQQSISVKIRLNLGEVYAVEFVTSMNQARNYDVYSSKELE